MSTHLLRSSLLTIVLVSQVALAQRPATTSSNSLTITTQPNAIVWIDDIRRGKTDTSGKLSLTSTGSGRRSIRVRANGFKEAVTPVPPGGRGNVVVKLIPTT